VGRPIPLPPEHERARLFARLAIDGADAREIVAGWPSRSTGPQRWSALERAYAAVERNMGGLAPIAQPAPPAGGDAFARFFYVYVYLAATGDVIGYHRRRALPDDVSWATLADLGRNLRRDRLLFGEGGLRTCGWLSLHFRGGIYELGRLQFSRMRLHAGHVTEGLREGEDTLGIHIFEGGPLDPASCDASLARAGEFFARHFPETLVRIGVCTSWLLDPQLAGYLPAHSNVVRFQKRFRLIGEGQDGDRDIVRFVFHCLVADLDTLPQRTTLERAIVAHLRGGGHWRNRTGWLEL
jgi:GNAT domain-containint protein/N-acyltransferase family protein